MKLVQDVIDENISYCGLFITFSHLFFSCHFPLFDFILLVILPFTLIFCCLLSNDVAFK